MARRVSRVPLAPLVAAAGLAVFGAVAGCGPSFQAIYEGDSRFEHCYALEENPSVSLQQKGACWKEWTRHYTYGQTRDRVEYAVARSRALTAGHELPTDEAMMGAAPGEGRRIGTAPAPTNAFAPPPKTLSELDGGPATPSPNTAPSPSTWGAAPMPSVTATGDAGAPASAAMSAAPPSPGRPPLADCTDRCGVTWTLCKTSCEAEADKKKCDACEKSYKTCIRACAR